MTLSSALQRGCGPKLIQQLLLFFYLSAAAAFGVDTAPKKPFTWLNFTRRTRSGSMVAVDTILCAFDDSQYDNNGIRNSSLFVWQPGGGLFAMDYLWICDAVQHGGDLGGAVAVLVNPRPADVMNLTSPARDTDFLVETLLTQNQNESSPLYNKLDGTAIAAGHSKGAAVSLLTKVATTKWQCESCSYPNRAWNSSMGCQDFCQQPPKSAVVSIAPGLYGTDQTTIMRHEAPRVAAPTLFLLGDQDCCNEVHAQTLPIYNNISSTKKSIVLLHGANHCHWASPLQGSCALPCSSCGDLDREEQQRQGAAVVGAFSRALKAGTSESWAAFEAWLSERQDEGRIQFRTPSHTGALATRCPCAKDHARGGGETHAQPIT